MVGLSQPRGLGPPGGGGKRGCGHTGAGGGGPRLGWECGLCVHTSECVWVGLSVLICAERVCLVSVGASHPSGG